MKIQTVLIVDDSSYKRDTIKDYIKKTEPDITVFTFENPSLFISHIREQIYEPGTVAVFLDMQMPVRSGEPVNMKAGLYVLHSMKRLHMHIPAAVVSSETIDDGDAKSMYAYFTGSIVFDSMVYQQKEFTSMLQRMEGVRHVDE